MEGPVETGVRVEALCASVRRLARYRPESVVCLSGPLGEHPERDARARLVAGLQSVAEAAREADVTLAFEPIHRSERETTSFVNSIEDAIGILGEAELDDVGLLLDLFHVWDDRAVWDTIGRIAYRIAGVHVADWPADPRRTDRELPGLGTSGTRGAGRRAPALRLRRLTRRRDLRRSGRVLGSPGRRGRPSGARRHRRFGLVGPSDPPSRILLPDEPRAAIRDRDLPVHGHRGLDPAAPRARTGRRTRRRSPSIGACSGRRSPPTTASRSTRRATRSSSPSRPRRRGRRGARRADRARTAARSGSGWGCTPERRR